MVSSSLPPSTETISHLQASRSANTSDVELKSRKTVSKADAVDLRARRVIHDAASATPPESLRLSIEKRTSRATPRAWATEALSLNLLLRDMMAAELSARVPEDCGWKGDIKMDGGASTGVAELFAFICAWDVWARAHSARVQER